MFTKELLVPMICFFSLMVSYIAAAEPFTIIEDKAKLPILTPAFSERKTLKIRLENGLDAYLISDPNTDKSAAALSVKAGSWEDPIDYPGIAHFLEHMLFLGTKKFPHESEYSRYITENGGQTNAFTSSHYTSYLFSINNNAFVQALDRFSDFFKEPLFNPSGVDRELQAIDQEYAKNLDNDGMRELFVFKELANPLHPYHNFNIGNTTTLKKVSQETLKKWYKQHYSANLMKLVVYSALPIEKLKNAVVKDFADVPNNNIPAFQTSQPAFTPDAEGKLIYIEPVKNVQTLSFFWEFPSKFDNMKDERPQNIIAQIMGHEGNESLLAKLKKENLAESLRAGGRPLGSSNMTFGIEIELTDSGLQHLDQVIALTFQALENLRKKEIPAYIFDEMNKMATIKYQYQARDNAFYQIMKQASWIVDEDLETYPEQTLILQKFDPEAIKEMLNYMTPQRAIYSIMAPSDKTGVKFEKTEKWLKVPYTVQSIPTEKLMAWAHVSANPEIDLPKANKLIPQQLSLHTSKETKKDERLVPVPSKVIATDSALIYCTPDTRYHVPEIWWQFQLKTPEITTSDVKKLVLADLYAKSLKESLNQMSYDAQLAGLDYTIERKDNHLAINVKGYSENASVLFDEIVKKLKEKPSEDSYNVYKEAQLRKYFNNERDTPLKQARELFRSVLYKNYPLPKERFETLNQVTYEEFKSYIDGLYTKLFIEGMLTGNMEEKDATLLTQKIQIALEIPKPYPLEEQTKEEVVILPKDKGPFFFSQNIQVQGNAVIEAVQFDPFSFKSRAVQQILSQSMNEPFFSTLRTKQQTGYIVYNSAEEVEKQMYSLFAVQSNTHNPRDLLARFDLFIEGFMQEMSRKDLTEERFNVIKDALVTNLKQPSNNLSELGSLLNNLAFNYDGDFDWIDKRIKAFEELTYPEFLVEAQTFMNKQNRQRFAILVNGIEPQGGLFQFTHKNQLEDIRKDSTYK